MSGRPTLGLAGGVGGVIVVVLVMVAMLGPLAAPYSPGAFSAADVFEPCGRAHILGTDYLGRDVFSRWLHGVRYSVGLALAAALAAETLGVALALTAALGGRLLDEALSRVMDALISIPSKIFALVMAAGFGSSSPLLLVIATVAYTPGAYRIGRSLAVQIAQLDYVAAARVRGEGRLHLAAREILPNMIRPIAADFGLRFGYVVLLLSSMSFLGLGVQPPAADLGSLVRENMSGLAEGSPAVMAPALTIAALTVGLNLFIDALSGAKREDR